MNNVVQINALSEDDQPHSKIESGPKSVGEQLAFARSEQQLTVEQIASKLKWSARQISEIEAGNYEVFPDQSTIRGFVRTYAKILKLDSTLIVAQLSSELARLPVKAVDREDLDMPFSTGRMPWLGRQNNRSQWILAALFLLCLCMLAVFVYRLEITHAFVSVFPEEKHAELPAAVSANEDMPLATVPLSSTAEQASLPAAQTGEAKPSATVEVAVPKQPLPVVAEPAAPVNPKPVEKINPPATVATENEGLLEFNFKQDSWLQIKRLDGTIVISRLYKAGSQETVNVNSALNIVIGNGNAVVAKLRGQVLELQTQNGSKVVNLSIK